MGPIHAIYENGVFKPKAPVALPDGWAGALRTRATLSADGNTLLVLNPDDDSRSGKDSSGDCVE